MHPEDENQPESPGVNVPIDLALKSVNVYIGLTHKSVNAMVGKP